ncbi:hypothetical protein C8J57DRAFT_1592947 [Mycena rebaudengoi]|nr:hypothetical protein C8J57DRAFT_1592947 [Mycena rebaudengoi]
MKRSAAFFALVPLVAAMPPAARTVEASTDTVRTTQLIMNLPVLKRRQVSPKPNVLGNVFVCVNPNFVSPCATFHGASGQCINFPPPFQHSISSVGPDPGQDCVFFTQVPPFNRQVCLAYSNSSEPNCVGRQLVVRAPGIADLATVGFDDVIMSFNWKAFIKAFITKLKNPRLQVCPDS